jgi:hypothetical protein
MTEKEIFISNLFKASGGHGLTELQLHKELYSSNDINMLVYTIKKAVELNGNSWLSVTESYDEETVGTWSTWHQIDEKYSPEWGFKKTQPGCYIYGLFDTPPTGQANHLMDEVFYIGESRAVTRNCMLGRRGDFVSTVRNNPHCPYGCGTSFLNIFGKENIDKVYQAYLPTPAYQCKKKESDLLVEYYKKYGKIPVCNYHTDLNRIAKLASNLENFIL